MMELEYAIFASEDKHFPLKDPDKFHKMMKHICDQKGYELKTVLKYYYDRHVDVYKTYLNNNVPVDNELFKAGLEMVPHFEKWLKDV